MHVVSFSYECLGRSVRGLSVAPYESLPTSYDRVEKIWSSDPMIKCSILREEFMFSFKKFDKYDCTHFLYLATDRKI